MHAKERVDRPFETFGGSDEDGPNSPLIFHKRRKALTRTTGMIGLRGGGVGRP
jgi:hypothetical protein